MPIRYVCRRRSCIRQERKVNEEEKKFMDRLTREHVKLIEQDWDKMLREHSKKLAAALADATGYLASVRTDRKIRDQFGNVYVGQTPEWAEGAKEFSTKANELLEAHDALNLG
jgi:nicotinamide riboside kinase